MPQPHWDSLQKRRLLSAHARDNAELKLLKGVEMTPQLFARKKDHIGTNRQPSNSQNIYRQSSNSQKIYRQPSKTQYFYCQLSNGEIDETTDEEIADIYQQVFKEDPEYPLARGHFRWRTMGKNTTKSYRREH